MALARQTFNHSSPSAPTLAGGALLGASGVTHAQLHTIGVLSGTSAANGAFSDIEGYGHIDYHAGYLYVFDGGVNDRVQRFVLNVITGQFDYDSRLDGISALVGGGGTTYGLLAIDRARNQIHIARGDHTSTGSWISVWNLSDWGAGLTTLNRVRQYGSNSASSDASGRSYLGLSLVIGGDDAVVASALSPFRCLRWNHVTGVLQNQETQATTYQFATDGAGNWWSCAHAGAAEPGLWKIDITTFTGMGLRLDTASQSQLRLGQFSSTAAGQRPFYYGGRVYVRDSIGRVTAWDATSGLVVDDFALPGSLGPSNAMTGAQSPSHNLQAVNYRGKGGAIVVGDAAYYVTWSHNASGTASQSFLTLFPITPSTATWTKNNWSAGTNTIKAISVKGSLLGGEKYKLELRKNGGSLLTVTSDLLQDEATLDWVTFTGADALEVKLIQDSWSRLDGAASLIATRDKLSPANVAVQVIYEDTVADVYVPYASAGFKGRIQTGGAYKGRSEY